MTGNKWIPPPEGARVDLETGEYYFDTDDEVAEALESDRRLAVITAEELEAKEIPPLRWIIPGILPEGLCIVAGAPKAGKSALMLGWANDLEAGQPIMGRIPVEPCEVLYIALEDNERRVRDRLRKIRGRSGK